jgi:superfamily II DNA/RNA helicase
MAAGVHAAAGVVQKPQVVVMAPTRELAIQIHAEFTKFAYHSAIKANLAYGGTGTRTQADRISRGTNVLVATPGRLKAFVDEGRIDLSECIFFVLDEADRMLDMGFRVCSSMDYRCADEKEKNMSS